MEADWEVEIGGDAPVIEAEWPGFIDLRAEPARISDIVETATFLPLAHLLLALNAESCQMWTSKCDVWEPAASTLACYIDLLPREGKVFGQWREAEIFCRKIVDLLRGDDLAGRTREHGVDGAMQSSRSDSECAIALVIRQAIAGQSEGFGVTAYLSAKGDSREGAAEALARVTAAFADALLSTAFPMIQGSNSEVTIEAVSAQGSKLK